MSTNIQALPVECLVHILSLTSPEDILRSSAASKQFHSAAISDELWNKFLPSDYREIITQSSSPIEFCSLYYLFTTLCQNHILINQNTTSFSLDRKSWKKCFMLGSRSLTIAWGDDARYWSWICSPESRFPDNANLKYVFWLNLKGVFPTKWLSRNTTYGAYLVFTLTSGQTGFEGTPMMVSVIEVDEHGLRLDHGETMYTHSVYLDPEKDLVEREDGWMEVELGTYQAGSTPSETVFLEMNFRESELLYSKHSFLVQGIELRPMVD